MYAYDTGNSRRYRDVPPISSSRYRDKGLYGDYTEPARSRSTRYQDPEPAAPSPYDRHRRKSVSGDEGRAFRRANVVASDDGRGSRDAYGAAYPERTSRHDAEAKTSDRNRQFREQRRGYQAEEAENLKRAKSYSPRAAARNLSPPRRSSPQAPPSKSAWPEEGYGSDPYRSSTKKARGQQYYGEDPYGAAGTSRDRVVGGKNHAYGSSPAAMPRPPAGDYAPYRTSPLSSNSGGSDEKQPKHSSREPRAREQPNYGSAYPDYDPYEPPRRSRPTRVPEEKHSNKPAPYDDYGYAAPSRGRDRPLPAREYDDPYDRAPRSRQRQSMPPPHARSRYPAYEDDNYGAPPRRAASVNHGSRYGYEDAPPGRTGYPPDRAGGGGGRPKPTAAGGSGGLGAEAAGGAASKSQKAKQKKWGKQAGKLFMTHAVPVIKQEAVPFLTKAAQAYMQQKSR
ncbi:unnamed protein product [Discula destructiva]